MVLGQHRQRVRTDLVRGIAVGGDAIGARHHEIDVPPRHHRGRDDVGDQPVRNAVAHALPGGQPRPLHDRARLVHPEQRDLALRVGGAHDAERGAIAGRRQRAGIAMRENARVRRHQVSTVVAERLVGGEVFGEDRLRLRGQTGARLGHGTPAQAIGDAAHALERPEEVDGGRPRGGEPLDRGLEVGEQRLAGRGRALARGERHAEGGGDADGGRAANHERANRLGHVLPARVFALQLAAGQQRLVEEDEPLAGPAHRRDD